MKQLKSQAQAATTPAPRYPVIYPYYPPPMLYPYPTTPAPAVASPAAVMAASPAAAPTTVSSPTTLAPMSVTPKPDGIAAQALRKLYRGAAAGPAARQPDAVKLYWTQPEGPDEPVPSQEFDPYRPSPSGVSLAKKEQDAWNRAHNAAQGLTASSVDNTESSDSSEDLDPNEKPGPPLFTFPEKEPDPYLSDSSLVAKLHEAWDQPQVRAFTRLSRKLKRAQRPRLRLGHERTAQAGDLQAGGAGLMHGAARHFAAQREVRKSGRKVQNRGAGGAAAPAPGEGPEDDGPRSYEQPRGELHRRAERAAAAPAPGEGPEDEENPEADHGTFL